MTAALLRKELHQHWWALALVGLLSLLGIFWVLAFTALQDQGGSQLFALRLHAFLLAASALILTNRLVVAEYGASTQIFLESLPLPRLRVVLVKYFLGLAVILLCAALALGAAMAAGARTEAYTPRFVAILNARYLCFAAFAYSFFFGMGFLGRYRFAAYALLAAGLALVVKTREVEMHQLAPFYLVGSTFPFEREVFPATALAVTAGLAAAFFLLAAVLACAREGSISSLLGERMSYRDKIALAALSFGLLSALFILDERKVKEPYAMAGASTAGGAGPASVSVAPASPQASALARRLAADLDALAEYLGLDSLPPVFLIDRPDLDPDQQEHGWIEDAEGIILRAAWTHPDWRYERCLEQLAGDAVSAATLGRADKEDRFWALDGFTLYWPHRREPGDPLDADRHLLLRALHGREILGGPARPEDLRSWFSLQNEVGHEITAGIGWSMIRHLEHRAGPEAARAFLRSLFAAGSSKNALVALRDLRRPPEQRFREHAGMELGEFLDDWNAALDLWLEPLAAPLAAIPRLRGELELEPDPGGTARARFRFEPPAGAQPGSFVRPVLLYGEPAPFRASVPEPLLRRQPILAGEAREGWLPDTWSSGSALSWTFAADSPELGCRLVSGWRLSRVP